MRATLQTGMADARRDLRVCTPATLNGGSGTCVAIPSMARRLLLVALSRRAVEAGKARMATARDRKPLLLVSGQVGSRSDGSPEPDFEARVRLAFANVEATCGRADAGLTHGSPDWTATGVNWLAGFDVFLTRAVVPKHACRCLYLPTPRKG